ncbi:MAG: DUF4349 domain-containing protein [Cyanobacteria bacterium J06627_8]
MHTHPLDSNHQIKTLATDERVASSAVNRARATHHLMWPISMFRNGLLTLTIMGGLLAGCASSYESSAPESAAQLDTALPATEEAQHVAQELSDEGQRADVPESSSQLVKRAELSLDVETVDDAIDQVTVIVRGVGGDILMLQNQLPRNETSPHVASLQLRVPQTQLDTAMEQFSELGAVDQQSLMAEDVSSQLVDFEARLRNLRKAEETVLGIMERSGEIGDVLQVAQELRNIRQSIEQIDGQLASLRNQVRYSTISLTLRAEAASIPSQTTVVTQLGDSWQQATRSVGSFTVGLMQLGIWLLVYSPYWLVIAAMGYGVFRFTRSDRQSTQSSGDT